MFTATVLSGTKPEQYTELLAQVRALLHGERDRIANAANLSALVYHALPSLNWVGFYFFDGRELVVGLRLGCINHARLSVRAIRDDGVELIGWIANEVDPAMARIDDNFEILRQRLPVPCWGRLPHAPHPDPANLAKHLEPPL